MSGENHNNRNSLVKSSASRSFSKKSTSSNTHAPRTGPTSINSKKRDQFVNRERDQFKYVYIMAVDEQFS